MCALGRPERLHVGNQDPTQPTQNILLAFLRRSCTIFVGHFEHATRLTPIPLTFPSSPQLHLARCAADAMHREHGASGWWLMEMARIHWDGGDPDRALRVLGALLSKEAEDDNVCVGENKGLCLFAFCLQRGG